MKKIGTAKIKHIVLFLFTCKQSETYDNPILLSECSSVWLECCIWDAEVACSNRVIPTVALG